MIETLLFKLKVHFHLILWHLGIKTFFNANWFKDQDGTMRAGYNLTALAINSEVAQEAKRMVWPEGVIPGSLFTAHSFQGRKDRDCEICGAPDRNPVHKLDYKNDPNYIPSGPLAVQKKFSELIRGDVVEIQGARRLTVSEPPELVEGSQFWRAEVVEHSTGLVRLPDDDVWVVDVRLVDLKPIGF